MIHKATPLIWRLVPWKPSTMVDEDHHIWRNNGGRPDGNGFYWIWLRFYSDGIVCRKGYSLKTKSIAVARRRRDRLYATLLGRDITDESLDRMI